MLEPIAGLHQDVGRALDEIGSLEDPIDTRFREELALAVRHPIRELSR